MSSLILEPVSNPTNDSDKEKYRKALTERLESIKKWKETPDTEQMSNIIPFINAIGRLFLEYYQDHLDEAKECAKSYQALLQDNYALIDRYYVQKVAYRIESTDFAWDDPWSKACLYWTNIEAFNAMFEGITNPLRTDELEEYMENWRGNACIDADKIPKRLPESHWWWFDTF